MRYREAVERIKALADERGVPFRIERKRGKGSHSTPYFGDRRTVVPDLKREAKAGTLHAILRQPGIESKEFLGR